MKLSPKLAQAKQRSTYASDTTLECRLQFVGWRFVDEDSLALVDLDIRGMCPSASAIEADLIGAAQAESARFGLEMRREWKVF